MYPKKTNPTPKLVAVTISCLLLIPAWAFAESNVRIELQRKTQNLVRIAVTPFVSDAGYRTEKLSEKAHSILENDLKLSELFKPLKPDTFEGMAIPVSTGKVDVDYHGWHDLGAQWVTFSRLESKSRKTLKLTFRVYDIMNQRFILGKRYTTTKKHLRRVVHKFADSMVQQLTGKRGVADTQIAFISREGGNKEIYSIDFDGENLKKLTNDRSLILTPAWSPDRKWIVYTSYAAKNPDLVMVDSYGKRLRKTLLQLPGLNAAPAWAPSGSRIALVLSKDQNSEIYILEKNYSLKRLTRHFNIDTSPTWSPDGKRIAFTSDRSGTGSPQIYIMDASLGDKGKIKRVTYNSTYNDNPAWSPDGDQIAYTSRIGKRFQIKIYDFETKTTTQFSSGSGNNEQPTWSPDGRFLAYRHTERRKTSVYVKRLGSNNHRQLSFVGGGSFSPAWSPHWRR